MTGFALRKVVWPVSLALGFVLAGCGSDGSAPPSGGTPSVEPPAPESPPSDACDGEQAFSSTFEGIQEVIFERHGCTNSACHGAAAAGGLDLRPDVAYSNLIEVSSSASAFPRITPGDDDRSFLYLKLAAKTLPEAGIQIAGAPMPNGLPALTEDELLLVRRWILGGAPETGTVDETAELLGACLPDPEPITIKPLDPPAPDEGVQFVMPEWDLPAASEHEGCFASYYDVSDQVPPEFQDPSGTSFLWNGFELRQDPQSHHLILNYATIGVDQLDDPSFGEWTCRGGARHGEPCEPTDLAGCGEGHCASEFKDGFACIGYGPSVGGGRPFFPVGGAQQAQARTQYAPGVFAPMPLKGVLYWNSHAFNLTTKDHEMNGRLNYYFAPPEDRRWTVRPIFDTSRIFAANAAPFTTQTVCHDFVLPRGARLFNLSSHTHQRGKHFTVELPDGTLIYESFVYNDPVDQTYDPPLAFDSPRRQDRTLHYCSLYNNGVNEDGSPNPETVTRASRIPTSAQQTLGRCKPVACVNEGMIGEPCNGANDNASCDTSPGAGDGLCDACPITGGESTENEMFILIGSYYVVDPES